MKSVRVILLLAFAINAIFVCPGYAFWGLWETDTALVSVNEDRLTEEDFRYWWKEWREEGMALPTDPDAYIDWTLQWREAEKMQLYEKESYRHKVDVFLKVWSLMQLKQEEVDGKLGSPPPSELWDEYLQGYAPRVSLRMVRVPEEKKVAPMQAAIEAGHSLEQAAALAGGVSAADFMDNSGLLRPFKIPEPLRLAVRDLPVGEKRGPIFWEKAWYFLEVLNREAVSDEDFQKYSDVLTRKWQKERSAQLTAALVEKAMIKYRVTVNEEVVKNIGPGPLAQGMAEQPAVYFGDEVITAQAIDALLRKARQSKPQEDYARLRDQVISDMLAQTLTAMEAIDRHYETRTPFKHTYQFYRRHRLIKELETELFWPRVRIAEEDIRKEYLQHPGLYCAGGMVELAQVRTREKDLARRISAQLSAGEDFYSAMRPLVPQGVQSESMPLNHLESPVRETVSEMSAGEVKSWEDPGGEMVFIKLVRRDLAPPQPLEEVAEKIRENLRQKRFEEVRNQFIQELRKRSEIKTNVRAWEVLRQQLLKEEDADAES